MKALSRLVTRGPAMMAWFAAVGACAGPPTEVPWALPTAQRLEARTCADGSTPAEIRDDEPGFILLRSACNRATPAALVVIVPGYDLSAEAYLDVGRSVQASSAADLDVAVLSLTGKGPDPLRTRAAVARLLAIRRAAAAVDGQDPIPIYLAGHSLGSVTAAYLAERMEDIAGVILLAGYLPELPLFSAVDSYPKPLLTLGGELDGRAWLTRLAREVQVQQRLAERVGDDEAAARKPVVVLPGVTHRQFADGSPDPEDLAAELPLADAHARIGALVADFIAAQAPLSDPDAAARLLAAVQATAEMVRPFVDAVQAEQDGSWCARSQRALAEQALGPSNASRLGDITARAHGNLVSFAASKPSFTVGDGGVIDLQAHSRGARALDLIDASPTTPESATALGCKMSSAEAIAGAAALPWSGGELSCRDLNELTFAWAQAQLSPQARQRFAERGKALLFEPDIDTSTGVGWLASPLSFQPRGDTAYAVQSPALVTSAALPRPVGGVHYCMLLSPARAIEWMLIEGLKK